MRCGSLPARNHRRFVQLSAAQVVGAAAVDGEGLCQRAPPNVERLCVGAGDVVEIGRGSNASNVGVAAQSGAVSDNGPEARSLSFRGVFDWRWRTFIGKSGERSMCWLSLKSGAD